MSEKKRAGIWYAIIAFGAWGVLPLYWKALQQVPAHEILAHRVLWSFVFVLVILVALGRWKSLKEALTNRSVSLAVLLSSLLISCNWFIYIWAVNDNHIIETSLGYYINPLLNIILGMLVLKERLNFWELFSLFLAFTGVVIRTVQYGKIPWIALSLAITFALYGLVKKTTKLDTITGLAMETAYIAPLAFIYLVFLGMDGAGSFGVSTLDVNLLLLGSGIVTAMPLLWFAQGTQRVSLSTIGFIQYISPTASLLIGVLVYKEPFTGGHLVSFGFIWSALLLYSFSQTGFMQSLQPEYFKAKNVN
ncbi:MAG: EamA family transporter RarD [Clostridia bacterium]|nr:EamA family transporter RarD [Clostridia bacterium]